MNINFLKKHGLQILRWVARMLGTAQILLVALVFIGEVVFGPEGPPPLLRPATIMFIMMLLGLMIAWRWEGPGGLLSLLGYIGFAIVNQSLLLNTPFVVFPITAIMYLCCWWGSRRRSLLNTL
ncbi:MAG: hypothetical protein ABIH23_21945 [bacterium]